MSMVCFHWTFDGLPSVPDGRSTCNDLQCPFTQAGHTSMPSLISRHLQVQFMAQTAKPSRPARVGIEPLQTILDQLLA